MKKLASRVLAGAAHVRSCKDRPADQASWRRTEVRIGTPAPVFYGETLVGDKMPNLSYMTTSKTMEAQNAGWERFRTSPKWITLQGMDMYKDSVSKNTKEFLKPTPFSQI